MDRPRSWRSQGIDLTLEPVFRIGGARIDPVSREAEFAGARERLQPQNLKVLIALARRRGQVVTRADLIELCWDGRIVGEDVINHSISVLRAFAVRAGGFAIETVPKAGYRLTETVASAGHSAGRAFTLGWAVAAAIAVGLLFAVPRDKQAEPPVPTVALMTFGATAGDSGALEVARAARVSLSDMLADGGFPVRLTNARDERSDFLISGDIHRRSGRIEAMVRIEENRHNLVIFTRRFEVADDEAASLPDQIGALVAANLSWTGALMILDGRSSTDPRITGELLKQMSLIVAGGDTLRAYQIARQIAPKAPNSAMAQLALAFNTAFALGELPREEREAAVARARRASERGRALAPQFGDVHIPWCILHSPVRLGECEARLREGMRADPDAPFVAAFLSSLLRDAGRFEDALKFARMAIADDPYMPSKLGRMIHALDVTGRRREADELYSKAVRWWPQDRRIYWGRLLALIERGDLTGVEKLAGADRSLLDPARKLGSALRSRDAASAGRSCSQDDNHRAVKMLCLAVLAELGQLDAAYAMADEMYPQMQGRNRQEEERLWLDNPYGYPIHILSSPSAAALRRDPRFLGLADRVGLVEYWRTVSLPDFCRKASEPVCSRIRQ